MEEEEEGDVEAHLAVAGGEDPADLGELLHGLGHGGAVEVPVLGQRGGGQLHPGNSASYVE